MTLYSRDDHITRVILEELVIIQALHNTSFCTKILQKLRKLHQVIYIQAHYRGGERGGRDLGDLVGGAEGTRADGLVRVAQGRARMAQRPQDPQENVVVDPMRGGRSALVREAEGQYTSRQQQRSARAQSVPICSPSASISSLDCSLSELPVSASAMYFVPRAYRVRSEPATL